MAYPASRNRRARRAPQAKQKTAVNVESRRVVATTFLAGTLGCVLIDAYLIVTLGWIFHNATALQISQWDASNALGPAAFRGGLPTALLGFAMHYCVSIVWAALYVLAALRARVLLEHPVPSGVVFGIAVMLVMKYVVVPLGHASQPHARPAQLVNQILAHVLAFGIPVALVVTVRLHGVRTPQRA